MTGNDDFWHELAGGAGDSEAHLTAFTEKIFEALDDDRDGTVTAVELKAWLRKGRDATAGRSDTMETEGRASPARTVPRNAAVQGDLETRMAALEDGVATMASQLADVHAMLTAVVVGLG